MAFICPRCQIVHKPSVSCEEVSKTGREAKRGSSSPSAALRRSMCRKLRNRVLARVETKGEERGSAKNYWFGSISFHKKIGSSTLPIFIILLYLF